MEADDGAKYTRQVQTTVTNFLVCGDYYLFLHRNSDKRTDPNRLNGVGGRLEPGEDFLAAAIRETEEETGYVVAPSDIRLAGVVKTVGGYSVDWVVCFFKITVPNMQLPRGTDTEDGKLVWLHKDKVLDSEFELVDDINYCFKEIVEGKEIFFMTAILNDSQKITSTNISKIKC